MDLSGFDMAITELSTGDPVVRFMNGKWKWNRSGDEKVTLEMGQRLAVNLFETERGWLHFGEAKDDAGKDIVVLDQKRLGKVAQRYKPESRKELGETDDSQWRKGSDGKPMDPWVHIWQFPAVLIGKQGNYQVSMTGSSMGWERSVGQLFQDWKAQLPLNQGKVPVIEIGARESKTRHGDRDFPVMTIADWKSLDEFKISEAPSQAAPAPEPEPKPAMF